MLPIANFRTVHRAATHLLGAIAACLFSAAAWGAHSTSVEGSVDVSRGFVRAGSITVSWPAFSTGWNDQIPSGSLTTAIDGHGRFSINLVPNAGATPSSAVYMAEYHLRDGNAWREYWSVPAESQVTLAEVRIAEPDPAGAQDNPAQPQPSQARTKQDEVPQHADMDRYGTQLNKQRSPGPANSHSVDTRNGHQADFYHDPDRNSFSDQNDSWLQVCNFTSLPGWTGGATGWTGTKNNCINQYQFNAAPGFDLGTPKVGPGGWSTHVGIHLNSVVNSPGISEMVSASQVKAGIGDNTGYYFYNFSYGGAVAGSDEGNHLTAALGGEQSTVYTGTIASGGTGATSLSIHCSADCQYPGDGRYLIDTQRPIASGFVTAKTPPDGLLTPGTFTIDTGINPSSAWGTLVKDVVTPIAADIGTGFTNMTFSVNVSHGRFSAGSLVCFGGQYHEQALVSSVSGSGPVTLIVPLRHAHESGSWIMQGGPCGTFIEFTANSVLAGNQKIRYPIDVLGATDSHTLVYRYFAFSTGSGYWAGNVTFAKGSATNLSNSGGTVTMTLAGGNQVHSEFYNASSIYISNAASPTFNGVCSDTKATATGQLACTQQSSTGATSTTAEVSYGTSASGNTAFNLWPGGEVLDVLDHSQSPPAVNGKFTLEPNSAAWTPNDTVENVHHYAARMDANHLDLTVYNPMKLSSEARVLSLHGQGISGGNAAQPTFYAADRINNLQPATNYVYHGGTVTPPGGIYLGGSGGNGLFDYALAMQHAPDPPGSSAIYIGCPFSGCADGAFFYKLFNLVGNGGATMLNFTPATNMLSLSGKGLNLKYEPLIAPTLQSETGGAAASLKFAPSDASGTAHTWILNAPPVGGGFTLTLPQASGTLALNNSFGPSGTNHSSGLVPDPGPNPGVARFLREDGKWVALGQRAATSGVASMRPAVLRLTPDQGDTEMPPRFPVVVAHASLDHQNTPLGDIIQYAPETDGTFRLTISVFVESRCASGTLLVNASLSPIAGHTVGQEKSLDCTEAYSNGTATITAHGATGVPITPAVKFKGVEAESLRYMVDVIVEQLQ